MAKRTHPLDRFVSTIEFGPHCWEWRGVRTAGGYGLFKMGDGRNATTAQRASYRLLVGPIPDGLEVDHLCRNPGCVNPDHLEAVTPHENKMRSRGLAAVNAGLTACRRGHEFTPENTAIDRAGSRHCLACRRMRNRDRRVAAVA